MNEYDDRALLSELKRLPKRGGATQAIDLIGESRVEEAVRNLKARNDITTMDLLVRCEVEAS